MTAPVISFDNTNKTVRITDTEDVKTVTKTYSLNFLIPFKKASIIEDPNEKGKEIAISIIRTVYFVLLRKASEIEAEKLITTKEKIIPIMNSSVTKLLITVVIL